MRNHRLASVLFLSVLLPFVLAACGSDPTATPTASPTATPTSAPTATPASGGLPGTSGAAVRGYLEEVDYQEAWTLWPGKGELYQGAEPHGLLLTTYLNEEALDALESQAGSMPSGAIIVKENYLPDETFDSTTVMYKVPGYNPQHNDWFWTKYAEDGTIQAEGMAEGCIACHGAVSGNDYVFTGPLE